jgi:hypothetical protein
MSTSPQAPLNERSASRAWRIHWIVVACLNLVMLVELGFLLAEGQWFTAFLVVAIILATASPMILGRRFRVNIPPEFQLMAVVFVFASLFLGEIREFYARIWWWDIALHASSGLLLGIVGFILVYALNENARIELSMRPRFVALFAFVFAVAGGALWEIFEFGMDQIFGTQMQKPMFDDPSGLTDTMWDLILDTLGAAVISVLGWFYMRTGRSSFLESGIRRFIENNPRLFPGGEDEREG